ncbi:helix-turn-helix domain-containing protein [Salibacterium aidingense]|uniref:helix-turn-helix domain-containing protein n=1 Tax=Salibacterium aidingense TaxID=384933 RepID=UPI00041C8786|nr:helix-turn-helix transcriptional regulator [Salibacterium aidingense]
MVSFGERLRNIRKEKGLSQKQLADKIDGLSNVIISHAEKDRRHLKADEIHKICTALNIDPNVLFDLDEGTANDHESHDEHDLSILQDRLLTTRYKKNLSRKELSRTTGISTTYIEQLENKDVEEYPDINTIFELAAGLGVTPDFLSGYVEQEDEFSSKTPKPKELVDFLDESMVVYHGTPLTKKDRERLKKVLTSLYFEAYEKKIHEEDEEEK